MLLRTYRDRAAPFVSALHFSYGAGGLAAPFLVAAFASGRETSVYRLLAIGFALLAAAYLSLPTTLRPLQAHPSRPATARRPDADSTSDTASAHLGRGFLVATSVMLFYVGAEIGFASWLYEFVNLQFAAATATAVTGGFWAAFSLSRLVAVFIARRFTPERILSAAFAGGLAFALLLVFSPHALTAVWIGAVGVGAAVGPIYPNVITAYSHRYELTGRRFGAIAVASCAGSMVFPWLIGRLLDVGGTVVVPTATVVLLAVAAGAAWAVFRHPVQQS
jgi:FHS family glucose/mannose:H+ symporter-like MFS transporter